MTFLNNLNSFSAQENDSYSLEAVAPLGQALAASGAALDLQYPSVPFRLRMTLHSQYALSATGKSLKLQYSLRSGTCDFGWIGEDYQELSQITGDIRFYNDPEIPNGASITSSPDDPTHGSHTNVLQNFVESNNFTNTAPVPDGSDALWDFALEDFAANFDAGYCFRIVNSDNSELTHYDVLPEISICKPPTNVLMRGGKYFCQGSKREFIW